ncbi:MAG: helix-turn-helix transcriptional regulator [Clostridia bacterium]|nr:helix-turn-helix transcriptional regulator [Clostridia bacterium]
MTEDKIINQRVRELRVSRKVNQKTLGKVLGIKTSTYSQMERKGNISAERLRLIAEYFKVDYNYLLSGEIQEHEFSKEKDINYIYETIKQELKAYYEERYNFLNSFCNAELKSLKTISYLSKPKRRAVFEYTCKLFKKEI